MIKIISTSSLYILKKNRLCKMRRDNTIKNAWGEKSNDEYCYKNELKHYLKKKKD